MISPRAPPACAPARMRAFSSRADASPEGANKSAGGGASGSESEVKSDDWSTTGMLPRAHLRGASGGAAASNATAATAAGLAAGPTESEGKTGDWGGGSSNTTAAVLNYDRMQDTKFESIGRSRNMPCGSATGGCSIAEAKQACAGYLACTGFWCAIG